MNRERGTLVQTRLNHQGIRMVSIVDESNKRKTRSVALFVARLYLRPPHNRFYNSVIHLNGDKSDCTALNLMWRPRWYAVNYHLMFLEEPIDISVEIKETGEVFGMLREACVKYGLNEQDVYMDLVTGGSCFHYGFRFQRVDL